MKKVELKGVERFTFQDLKATISGCRNRTPIAPTTAAINSRTAISAKNVTENRGHDLMTLCAFTPAPLFGTA